VDGHWHTGNRETIWRWRSAYQSDFESRMIWSVTTNYAGANHPPVARLADTSELSAKPSERIDLSAAGSTDLEGDALSYQWIYCPERGTFSVSSGRTGTPRKIDNADKQKAWFTVPTQFGCAGTLHVIMSVNADGKPSLARYQRASVSVKP
jgi:hypothetical protein